MTESLQIPVSQLTDAEVVARFTHEDLGDLMKEMLNAKKRELLSQMRADSPIRAEAEALFDHLLQASLATINQLNDELNQLALEVYSVSELRILLKFREDYPEIYQKSGEFGQKAGLLAGEITSRLMMSLAEMDLDAALLSGQGRLIGMDY